VSTTIGIAPSEGRFLLTHEVICGYIIVNHQK